MACATPLEGLSPSELLPRATGRGPHQPGPVAVYVSLSNTGLKVITILAACSASTTRVRQVS